MLWFVIYVCGMTSIWTYTRRVYWIDISRNAFGVSVNNYLTNWSINENSIYYAIVCRLFSTLYWRRLFSLNICIEFLNVNLFFSTQFITLHKNIWSFEVCYILYWNRVDYKMILCWCNIFLRYFLTSNILPTPTRYLSKLIYQFSGRWSCRKWMGKVWNDLLL